MTIAYTTGQITLTNGSAVVTGIGTAWQVSLIAGGFIAAEADGNPLPIETVDSDTSITAAIEWKGASGTYDYALVRDTAYLQQLNVNSNTLARLIAELDAGTIFKYDASGDLAGRATYDERAKGFSYLVFIGVDEPALYVKASATAGDWDGPFAYGTGPEGPPGPAGYVNYRGAYSAVTAYAKNDGVLSGGSTYVALQATTGNAPPTYPTTSTAYWQLTALKGTDGTGTGDVVGPAGATDDMPAFFDGTTGKLLKFKTKAQFKTWLAATAGDVSFDNSTANLPGAPATVQAAINAIGNSGGKNDALFALEIADLKGQRMGMVGGVADSFDDEAGIATKTNATYDAANDWYTPSAAAGARITGATPSGLVATPANINDNNTATVGSWAGTDLSSAAINSRKLAQLDLGSVQTISKIEAVGYYQSVGGNSTSGLYYSTDGATWTQLGANITVNTAPTTSSVTGSVSARYVALILPQLAYSGATVSLQDLNVYGPATLSNMTLVSVDYAASAVPSTARIAVQLADALTLTPGTDFTMEVSRDGGATWAAVTLALSIPLFGGVKMYEGTASISGQPSGSTMKWRFKTLTGKNIIASGVVLQQS